MTTHIHVSDHLILPYGRAVRDDLQKINLSAVSANGLYFSTEVPIIYINKSKREPLCLSWFPAKFGGEDGDGPYGDDDQTILEFMLSTLKSNNPNMTRSEELFLDLYFDILMALMFASAGESAKSIAIFKKSGLGALHHHNSPTDLWRALIPIPELQLYVNDPLGAWNFQPDNNFRVDYGFWDGEKLIAVEIDGAEPSGYARDIRRDRLLRRAGVDVIHILNLELDKHRGRALLQLLPDRFFGYSWDYEGQRPYEIPF